MTKDWKYYLGISLFAYSFIPICVVAALPFLGMSLAESGTLAVVFLATGEVAFYTAAALLGKEFLAALKKRFMGWFRAKDRPPQPVSRTRHRAGVILLALSFLPYYAVLADLLFFAPLGAEITFLAWTLVGGEVLGIVALFMLGAPFWDRLKQLFCWNGGQAQGPVPSAAP
ncbi:MAG: transporter suffix domain-containing protein [Desulfarculaceae bacterium]|nr:transporter suffix domain-containing protein [Desulfarculaceae bacterium]MCF8047011.1 transporter suffix domain-containing protein [Desulfarculaceae bacterium]MCF8066357.1 transporter suffix domain-containing protein [Desulfarculaceae bacterium]MCF8096517.1 transporter suffix domain-containing protein [Desulfarculaceae bacterium]MCF8121771.1 transporter suffix domain-containing protein [Desulfarculaceae bacterium]